MKKIATVILIIICVLMVSCSKPEHNEQDINKTSDFSDDNGSVPYLVSFSSVDEIKLFLSSSKGSTDQYNSYAQANKLNPSITQSQAQKITSNMENMDVPTLKNNLTADDFAATYYLDRNELDIIYKIDEIRYRFVYKFNKPTANQRTDQPVLEQQKLGSYVLDVYQGDECFVGTIDTDLALIQFVVYADQVNHIDLSMFNMNVISDNEIR